MRRNDTQRGDTKENNHGRKLHTEESKLDRPCVKKELFAEIYNREKYSKNEKKKQRNILCADRFYDEEKL